MEQVDEVVERAIARSRGRNELWTNLLSDLGCRSLCEVGVWKGTFAAHLLSEVPGVERYTLIDPWRNLADWNKPLNRSDAEFEDVRAEALHRLAPFEGRVVELRATTKEAAAEIDEGSLDFAYIDGDHTLRGITIDLHSMLPKVRLGGLIGGDDFTRTIWQHGARFSPTEVFPYAIYFAEAHDLTIHTLPFDQFLIVNDPNGFRIVDHAGYAELSPSDIYAPRRQPPAAVRRFVPRSARRRLRALLGR